jgi:hypothetical protein
MTAERIGNPGKPAIAARTCIRTLDVGIPILSMHSARELCGTAGPRLPRRGVRRVPRPRPVTGHRIRTGGCTERTMVLGDRCR